MDERRDTGPVRSPGLRAARRRKRTYVVRVLPPEGDAARGPSGTTGTTRDDRVRTGPPPGRGVTPEQRRRWIAEAAYYRAQKRGFAGGDPAEDWYAAEAEVDARLLGIGAEPPEPS